ncbi:MAG: M56 family metallopeptidase, partial [Planctomycetes bacterium]|nr:M56 family metallopeptidase [Planctomycetota bacterium]
MIGDLLSSGTVDTVGWLSFLGMKALTSSVMALGVIVIQRWVRSPVVVHTLWLIVLLQLAAPPLVDLPISTRTVERPLQVIAIDLRDAASAFPVGSGPNATPSTVVAPVTPTDVLDGSRSSWSSALFILWAFGAAMFLVVSSARLLRFQRVVRRTDLAPSRVIARVDGIARQFGLTTVPEVRVCRSSLPPLVWPYARRPVLLLPSALVGRVDDAQVETLIAHELAHLRRRDHWVRAFEMTLLAVYWWFPVLRLVIARRREIEELCCDAWVLWRFPERSRSYARTLLTTLDFLSESLHSTRNPNPPAVLPAALRIGSFRGLGRKRRLEPLKRRLDMILERSTPRRLSSPARVAFLVAGLCLLPLAPFVASAESGGSTKIVITRG